MRGRGEVALLFWLSSGLCSVFAAENSTAVGLAEVGRATISQNDLARRMGIDRAYGNEGIAPELDLAALINDTLEREVAKLEGVQATPAEIANFSKHADETSRAMDILTKV